MKRPALLLALLLVLIAGVLIAYRVLSLGYPLLPSAPEKTWQLSLEAHITGSGAESRVLIGLPQGFTTRLGFEERITSGSLDFGIVHKGQNRFGVWSGPVGPEGEVIGYRSTVPVGPAYSPQAPLSRLDPYPESVDKTEQAMAERLAAPWRGLPEPARLRAITSALRDSRGNSKPTDEALRTLTAIQDKHGRLTAFLLTLSAAGLHYRCLEGLPLAEGVITRTVRWVEVWTGKRWERVRPETGDIYPESVKLLPLTTGGSPAVDTWNAQVSEIRWTLSKQVINQWRLHLERIRQSDRLLDRWSLLRMPPEFQGTFRILLLVPIGALMICILRNVIGFPTFGIFMPVLMALAFRNTGLAYGLGIFAGVVFIGYAVRRMVDRLHLLLVPRLSVILTLVIGSFTLFALAGNRFGLREFMAVGLLPFVILTMTIERFFIIVEEEGLGEALKTAAGSAAVATITHEIIHLEPLQLTFFVYPELLFAVAAAQVLVGRYTGYRLSEFFRFRKFREGP